MSEILKEKLKPVVVSDRMSLNMEIVQNENFCQTTMIPLQVAKAVSSQPHGLPHFQKIKCDPDGIIEVCGYGREWLGEPDKSIKLSLFSKLQAIKFLIQR